MKKFLLVGFVGFSLAAFGQSGSRQEQSAKASKETTHNSATQTSGNPGQSNVIHRDLAARNLTVNSGSSATNSSRVATGDVNGDGHADLTATSGSNSGHATQQSTATTSAQTPRDATSGQASGKRQHDPLTVSKQVDAASPKLVTKQNDAASTKSVSITKETDVSSPK